MALQTCKTITEIEIMKRCEGAYNLGNLKDATHLDMFLRALESMSDAEFMDTCDEPSGSPMAGMGDNILAGESEANCAEEDVS